jgi:cytidylate kinase
MNYIPQIAEENRNREILERYNLIAELRSAEWALEVEAADVTTWTFAQIRQRTRRLQAICASRIDPAEFTQQVEPLTIKIN